MEPEPEPGTSTVEIPEQAPEGVPPPEELELATFLRSCAGGAGGPPQLSIKWHPEEFGNAVRAGFASLWAAVREGSTLAEGCDVVAKAGAESYSCHSLVLTVWSPVLRSSLEDRWSCRPSVGSPTSLQIDLGPADPADFKAMLYYCYTGELVLNPSNVVGMLHLSDFYGIEPVKSSCGEFLFRLLGNEQLPALLTIAEEYNVAKLRRACARVLADDFEELLEDGTLWSLSIDVWEDTLAQTSLAVADECTVLDAVLKFASPPHSDDAEARAARLERLLPFVRLPQLGERLIAVQQDPEIMAIPQMSAMVIHALTMLAFPDTDPRQPLPTGLHAAAELHTTPRVGLSSFDPLYTSGEFEVSNKRMTAKFVADPSQTMSCGQQRFLVVQPAMVSTARWIVSIDRLPRAAWAVNIWVCIDSDVLSMSPSSANPTSTIYAIYSSQQNQSATMQNSMGSSQHVPGGELNEGDIVTVELQERNGIHFAGFLKNGAKAGTPMQLEFRGMAPDPRRRGVRGTIASDQTPKLKWRLLISTTPTGANHGGFDMLHLAAGNQTQDVQFSLMRREPENGSSDALENYWNRKTNDSTEDCQSTAQSSAKGKRKGAREQKEDEHADQASGFSATDWALAAQAAAVTSPFGRDDDY